MVWQKYFERKNLQVLEKFEVFVHGMAKIV